MNNKGYVMVLALVIASVLLILLSTIIGSIVVQRRLVDRSYHRERALGLAESGIDVFIAYLNEENLSEPYSEISEEEIADMGTFSVKVTKINPSNGEITIESTGCSIQGSKTRASRTVLVIAKRGSSVFNYAITSQGDLKLEDSNTTVYGDVYCNGNIENGGATVHGAGFATGSVLSGETFFEDGVQEGVEQMTFPEIDIDYYKNNSGESYLGDHSFGNRTLNGKIIYVEGDVTVDNVTLEGPGVIVAEGSIKVMNGAQCGTSEDTPVGLLSNSTNSTEGNPAIKLEMAADVYGVIYAPRGYVKIETNSNIYGTIAGGGGIGIRVETGGEIHYTDYGSLGSSFLIPGTLRIVHWFEE